MKQSTVFSFVIILCFCLMMSGCAGPLDSVTKEALQSTFVGKTYLAKVYLGSRYNLDYTNNSVAGRSPTGVFIDQSRNIWYETDASFWESGTSGDEYTLERLEEIDRDLDFHTFGQGIQPGQIVAIKGLQDKKDQIVFEVETFVRYPVNNFYGTDASTKTKPRASRIHCIVGETGMQVFDQTVVSSLLDQILAPVPALTTEAQKHEFIITHAPDIPVDDLARITNLSKTEILTVYFSHRLSKKPIEPDLQRQLVEILVSNHETWVNTLGIHLQRLDVAAATLQLDCAIQEITRAQLYHSEELRASLIFFEQITFLAKALGRAFSPEPVNVLLETVSFSVSYLYFDSLGRRIPEHIIYTIPVEALQQYASTALTEQELADRTQVEMDAERLRIDLNALEAVQNIKQSGPLTWKEVEVEFVDWDYVEKEDEEIVVIQGEVKNRGTWIARNIQVIAKGYDKYNFHIRTETTSLYGLLKPGEIKSFTIKMNSENLKRFKLFLEWREVE
ncbi:methyl coenzyme m reductase [Candidatus Vecturithrix granuli]|uniref:Methyl coenzyme m reductase n=1 Tax=Vecturithrix granuli TaxID=1499967 RepID=A0A0S6W8Y4_VECG1|nr:methyl coenzyme m reductase [Candidatus Vecturithrix granuli]